VVPATPLETTSPRLEDDVSGHPRLIIGLPLAVRRYSPVTTGITSLTFASATLAIFSSLNVRDVGQFISRNNEVDNGRAFRPKRLIDGLVQLVWL
jgi:hypothetical protein